MILVAVDDLMLRSRVSSAAKQLGIPLRYVGSPGDAIALARTDRPSLFILDLNGARADPLRTIALMKAETDLASIRMLGFVSHVDTATIQAAREAGVDEVLARGAFVDNLAEILRAAEPTDSSR